MNSPQTTGLLFIFAAPSGAGKSTLVNALLDADPTLSLSISHTTRPNRPGEKDSQHYYFVSVEAFQQSVANEEFVEYARVFDNYYGTSRKTVAAALANGRDLLLEIDWQGAQQIQKIFPRSCLIFILPPSMAALRSRLETRGQDSDTTIEHRMRDAQNEISHYAEFDYVVVNDNFETTLADLKSIIRGRRLAIDQQTINQRLLLDELLNNE